MVRLGCVSFINSKPLVYGLGNDPRVQITYAVPSGLLELLTGDKVDVALLPIIDYQQLDNMVIVPATCIGADGHVYTVRLFSKTPISEIRTVATDPDSHTSVALCRILLEHVHGLQPEFRQGSNGHADAKLLIGDKVVCSPPANHPYSIDLAEEWKAWTGLPFVFAAWMGPRDRVPEGLAGILKKAMRNGLENVDQIVREFAVPQGWPAEVARDYLTKLLHFDLDLKAGSPQRTAIERFHKLAFEMDLIGKCREINVSR